MRVSPLAVVTVACASMLAACATTDPGWSGEGAVPFDTAQVECRAEVASASAEMRESRFEACMARRGWTRGEAGRR